MTSNIGHNATATATVIIQVLHSIHVVHMTELFELAIISLFKQNLIKVYESCTL